jgi:hypothetical protein
MQKDEWKEEKEIEKNIKSTTMHRRKIRNIRKDCLN